MSYIMNTFFSKEIDCQNPRAWTNNFINPFAVLDDFRPFLFVHNNFTFFLYGFLVTWYSNDKVTVLEKLLGLLEHLRVTNMVHIEDTISIYTNWVIWIRAIWNTRAWHGVVISWETIRKIYNFFLVVFLGRIFELYLVLLVKEKWWRVNQNK